MSERLQDRYRTPPELLRAIEREFGLTFTLDAAAVEDNAICADFLTGPHWPGGECYCGLCSPWEGTVWCNPPYSAVGPWVEKATRESRRDPGATIAMLLLADTSTTWFAQAARLAETYLLSPGRVSFIDPQTGQPARGNRIGSALFIWRPQRVNRRGQIFLWNWR